MNLGCFHEFGIFPGRARRIHKTPQIRELHRFLRFLLVFPGKTLRIHENTPNSRTGLRISLSLIWFGRGDPLILPSAVVKHYDFQYGRVISLLRGWVLRELLFRAQQVLTWA